MEKILVYLSRLFRREDTIAPGVTVIDQSAYFDLLERRQEAWISDMEQRNADRDRISFIVFSWARDCVSSLDQKSPSSLTPGEQVGAGLGEGHKSSALVKDRPAVPDSAL